MGKGILENMSRALYLIHAENKAIMQAVAIEGGANKEEVERVMDGWEQEFVKSFDTEEGENKNADD